MGPPPAPILPGGGWRSLLFAFQLREENDVSDGGGPGEEHDQAVDADADPAGRGHAVFEGLQEVVINLLGFAAALFFKAGALHVGIIELGVTW